jgi:hypothetical protein
MVTNYHYYYWMCDFIALNVYKQRDKNELSLMHIDSICSKIHQKRFNYE